MAVPGNGPVVPRSRITPGIVFCVPRNGVMVPRNTTFVPGNILGPGKTPVVPGNKSLLRNSWQTINAKILQSSQEIGGIVYGCCETSRAIPRVFSTNNIPFY